MPPLSGFGLYWSIRGEVACDEHTPEMDDPRWAVEGWAPVPVSDAARLSASGHSMPVQ